MKLKQLVERLSQFDQEAEVEFLIVGPILLELGSVIEYEKGTVTIELDEVR